MRQRSVVIKILGFSGEVYAFDAPVRAIICLTTQLCLTQATTYGETNYEWQKTSGTARALLQLPSVLPNHHVHTIDT
ncbi:hypothetical protein VKT23_011091 [Stygiomarasmius scandens]|uniref:Uncharacterized protein n=1 Tax=Marasmiellus scandens TaxID=2682957 RepID=A0ABR1JAT4_9AGAR